jgi:hypothetical protein
VCNIFFCFYVHTLIRFVFIAMDFELVIVPHGGGHASTVLILLCGFFVCPKGECWKLMFPRFCGRLYRVRFYLSDSYWQSADGPYRRFPEQQALGLM